MYAIIRRNDWRWPLLDFKPREMQLLLLLTLVMHN